MDLATTRPTPVAKLQPKPKLALEASIQPVSRSAPSMPIASLPTQPVPQRAIHRPPDPAVRHQIKPIAKADPVKPSLKEQQLTMKYAEGDANAAFDLAQLLFSQGRSEPAYVALEYAVRQKNPKAIALYSNLRPEVGAQL